MQSQFIEHQPIDVSEAMLNPGSAFIESDYLATEAANTLEPVLFKSQFIDCMEMGADAETVAQYLDQHQGWFCRCAHPMVVNPLGDNGYALTIGRFGSFGYEVEPKIGLNLLPPEQGVYRIHTLPVPDYVPPGYEVDFNANMQLVEITDSQSTNGWKGALTRVEWQLDLVVAIQFPKFIHKLPKALIQNTGDRVLSQIVSQVSRRLTYKVQEDFHSKLGLPMPQKSKKKLF